MTPIYPPRITPEIRAEIGATANRFRIESSEPDFQSLRKTYVYGDSPVRLRPIITGPGEAR